MFIQCFQIDLSFFALFFSISGGNRSLLFRFFTLFLFLFLFLFFLFFQSFFFLFFQFLLFHLLSSLSDSLNISSSGLKHLFLFFNTLAFHEYSTTFITKLKLTFACHMIAALIFFNPEFTFRTLFKLGSFNKIHKFFIIFR